MTRFGSIGMLLLCLGGVACGGDSSDDPADAFDGGADGAHVMSTDGMAATDQDIAADVFVAPSADVVVFVRDALGEPVANARVASGAVTALTSPEGIALLANLVPDVDVVVTARAAGHAPAYARVTPSLTEQKTLAVDMHVAQSVTIASGTLASSVDFGGITLDLPPPSTFVHSDGTLNTGDIQLSFVALPVAGLGAVPLAESVNDDSQIVLDSGFATFDITVTDVDGALLQLGSPIVVHAPLTLGEEVVDLVTGGESSLAVHSFDAQAGAWKSEGFARYADGAVTFIVSHLSWWQITGAFADNRTWTADVTGRCARGRIVDGSGAPQPNVVVAYSFRMNHPQSPTFVERATTDSAGSFCLRAPTASVGSLKLSGPNGRTSGSTTIVNQGVIARAFTVDGEYVAVPSVTGTGADACTGTDCAEVADIVHPRRRVPAPRCIANPASCDDGNPCTIDSCSITACPTATGCSGCEHLTAASNPCDDGNACTTDDACDVDAVCVGGAAVTCDDSDACTQDACDPRTGACSTRSVCAHDPNLTCTASPSPTCACADGFSPNAAGGCDWPVGTTTCATIADAIAATIASGATSLNCAVFDRVAFLQDCAEIQRPPNHACFTQWQTVATCLAGDPSASFACDPLGRMSYSGVIVGDWDLCGDALNALMSCM